MENYFWWLSEDYPYKAIACYVYEQSPDRFDFLKGNMVPEPVKPLIFDMEADFAKFTHFDSLVNNASLPLVNARVQALLDEHCPDDVQYLDAIIQYPGGTTTAYKAVNITHAVVSVDHDRSEYDCIDGEIWSFNRLTLLPGCLGKHDLARMQETKSWLLVSAKLVSLFKQHRIKGVYFESLEEYNARLFRNDPYEGR